MQNPPRTARRSKINSYDPPSRCLSAPAELSTMIVLHRSPSSPGKNLTFSGPRIGISCRSDGTLSYRRWDEVFATRERLYLWKRAHTGILREEGSGEWVVQGKTATFDH